MCNSLPWLIGKPWPARDEVEFTITDTGDVILRGWVSVPTDQLWYWKKDWHDGEEEASRQIATGELDTYEDAEAMFADLDRR